MKITKKTIIFIASTIAELCLTFILELTLGLKINGVSIVFVIGTIVILLTIVMSLLYDNLKLIKNEKELNKMIENLQAKETNQNTLGLNPMNDKGTRLLLMALCQNYAEPLKIELLEEAYRDNKNVLASFLLADIYRNGIIRDGEYILMPNLKKAYDIYVQIENVDELGVSDWELGWIYENNLLDDINNLDENNRLETACDYYKKSAEKGFPKAYNSLGKFYEQGLGGIEYDFHEAEKNYAEAARLGDVYAIMNYGLLSMKKYYQDKQDKDLLLAERYFNKAIRYNNSEGFLQLGIINEIRCDSNDTYLSETKQYYLKAIKTIENQYSATAYMKLGKLINRYAQLENDNEIISLFEIPNTYHLSTECLRKSYEIFHKIEERGGRLDGDYYEKYKELKQYYNNLL